MRAVEILLLVIVGLVIIGIMIERYLKTRQRERRMVEAYFSGGPLNGHSKKMIEFPERYVHMYQRRALEQSNAGEARDSIQITRAQLEPMVAIYNNQGGGVFVYQGSVDPDSDKLTYDDKNSLTS